jgi:hypothetical protein
MHGEDMGQLFEDLEQLAEGLHLVERDTELLDRSRSEYAGVTFAARLHASVGEPITLTVVGVGALEGTLVRVGEGWCLLATTLANQEWVVPLNAVTRTAGLSHLAVSAGARRAVDRLPLRSALREAAEARDEVVLFHLDGTHCRGRLARVGADFVELVVTENPPRPAYVVPLSMLAALRCG